MSAKHNFVKMMDSAETIYCSQQILVPPRFPHLLKAYAKDAIRTQPFDLLRWSAAYFRCLANGMPTPAKSRVEVPPTVAMCGLTPGYLRVLLKQFGTENRIKRSELFDRWMGLCLCEYELKKMLTVGRMVRGDTVPWLEFFAIAAGYLNNSLTHTMIMLCELLTCEPLGGSAAIPLRLFERLYRFLATMDCSVPRKYRGGRKLNAEGNFEEREEDWSLDGGGAGDVSEAERSEAVREVSEMMAEMQQQQQQSLLPDALFYSAPATISPTAGDGTGFDDAGGCGGDMVTAAICQDDAGDRKISSTDLKIVESIEIMQLTHANSDQEYTPINAVSEPTSTLDEMAIKRRDSGKQLAELDGKVRRATAEKKPADMAELRTELARNVPDLGVESPPDDIEGGALADEENESGDSSAAGMKIEPADAHEDSDQIGDQTDVEVGLEESELVLDVAEPDDHDMVLHEEAAIATYQDLPQSPGSSESYHQDTERMMLAEDYQIDGGSEFMYSQAQQQISAICSCYGESGGPGSIASGSEGKGADEQSGELLPCPKQAVRDYRKQIMETPSTETLQVPAIPGIGAAVPIEMQEEFLLHLVAVSKKQHGMMMPRNLRHYLCPPLEPDNIIIQGGKPPPQEEIAIVGVANYAENK